MIIFTLRRLLLLLVTLFFLTFVGFSLSYFTPHAPLQGSSLWDAWLFWFNGLLHWEFGVSSINGQLISEQPLALPSWWGSRWECWREFIVINGRIH